MLKGGPELVDRLRQDEKLVGHKAAKEGIEDMALLFRYLDIFNVTGRVSLTVAPKSLVVAHTVLIVSTSRCLSTFRWPVDSITTPASSTKPSPRGRRPPSPSLPRLRPFLLPLNSKPTRRARSLRSTTTKRQRSTSPPSESDRSPLEDVTTSSSACSRDRVVPLERFPASESRSESNDCSRYCSRRRKSKVPRLDGRRLPRSSS